MASNTNMMDDNTNNDTKDDSNDDCVEVKKEGEDNQNIKGNRKREKKQTSPVWHVFELLENVRTKDGIRKAKCTWCDEVKNYDSRYGTGNLQRHINKCYRPDKLVVGQMLLGKDKDSLMLKSSKFNKDIFREKLVRAIVMHNLPLAFVDYSGIKDLFEYVSEDLNLICRNTVRSDIVKCTLLSYGLYSFGSK